MSADLQQIPDKQLTPAEVDQLAKDEAIIEGGITVFYKVGMALCRIRDQRTYRATHDTFEAYVGDRWSMSRTRAYQLIESGVVANAMSTIVDIPPIENEGQARAIAPIVKESGPEVAGEILREIEKLEGKITARVIREKTKGKPKPPKPKATKTPEVEPIKPKLIPAPESEPIKVKAHVEPEPETEPIRVRAHVEPASESEPIKVKAHVEQPEQLEPDQHDAFEFDAELFEDIEIGVQSILFAVEHADATDFAPRWVAARGSTLTAFDLKRAARELEKVATAWESA